MRTFPGRSQRLTRSHSCRLHDRGVDLKRRPPKSRPAAPRWIHVSDRGRGPQGLRRPRFSFFRFTCQTARDRKAPLSEQAGEPPKPTPPIKAHRRLVTVISEELRRRAIAPSSGAPCGGYIGKGPEPCQPCQEQILSRPRNREYRRPHNRGWRCAAEARDPGVQRRIAV